VIDGGVEDFCGLVVSRGNGAKLLEAMPELNIEASF
jgi:hypothetical protein